MGKQSNLLPGILSNDVEFFQDGEQLKAITSGTVIDFTQLSFAHMQILRDEIEKEPDVKMLLLDMFPNSEFKRLEQFVKCRFGGLDYTADLTTEGAQQGEWWPCPLRGKCAHEGVLCKQVSYNGNVLDHQDVTLVQLLATNSTNDVIANEMNLPLGSFHLLKKRLYNKLGVQTKQESTIIGQRLNLI
ncbi:MalT transcriptional regulator family protein [Maribacter flavus]|uniref:HTH luxR-type domain-containing protein n=1 Tax=Maribacter flavus TaxID=1658664 RepID=A0A5B2TUY6_9FLAO|nr:hypothetical protein [Maribacter flavus]KAA2218287.1 hypothetical protein F0361_01305 [Maribacter flavus]